MFKKIYDFIDDYGSLFLFLFLIFLSIFDFSYFSSYIEKINKRDFDIINKTKNYSVYSSCKFISDKYYCWED